MNYVPDPSTRNSPLEPDEVEAMMRQGAQDLTKLRIAEHFLSRVAATIEMYRDTVNRLHREVAIVTSENRSVGAAPTMAPRDAVKYLSPQERAELADETTRDYILRLDRAVKDLEGQKAEMVRITNSARLALLSVQEDASLDPTIRARIAEAARRVPPGDVVSAHQHSAEQLGALARQLMNPEQTSPQAAGTPVPSGHPGDAPIAPAPLSLDEMLFPSTEVADGNSRPGVVA